MNGLVFLLFWLAMILGASYIITQVSRKLDWTYGRQIAVTMVVGFAVGILMGVGR